MSPNLKKLLIKTTIFILSLSVAWWLIKGGYLHNLIAVVLPFRFIAEIVAGIFYTSFLTAPVSIAMLVVLAQDNSPILTALLAGFGAVLGDFLIVKFFREKVSADLNEISKRLPVQAISGFLRRFRLDFLVPLLGAIIIASPLPDELGLIMLGVSKLKYREIALISFVLNTAGILLIILPINILS